MYLCLSFKHHTGGIVSPGQTSLQLVLSYFIDWHHSVFSEVGGRDKASLASVVGVDMELVLSNHNVCPHPVAVCYTKTWTGAILGSLGG